MNLAFTARRKRLVLLLLVGALLLAAGIFLKQAFRDNLVYFVTPGELASGSARTKDVLHVGGLVQAGSLQRASDGGLQVRFTLMDASSSVPVIFHGVLPDLFKEGKGAVAQGRLDASGTLVATEVLAKHDENYVPPQLHDALKRGEPQAGGKQ